MKLLLWKLVKRDKFTGQGMVEFALALPVFLLLLFGVIEISRMVYFYAAVNSASREAARYGSASGIIPTSTTVHYYQDCTGIKNAAVKKAVAIGLVPGDITIYYDKGPNMKTNGTQGAPVILGNCGTYLSDLGLGDRVVVTVSKVFSSSILKMLNKSFSSTTSRTVLTEVDISISYPPTATPLP